MTKIEELKEKARLTEEEMMAEIWDLAFGIEGAEGRAPTQKERFTRIATAQLDNAFKFFPKWCEEEGIIAITPYLMEIIKHNYPECLKPVSEVMNDSRD